VESELRMNDSNFRFTEKSDRESFMDEIDRRRANNPYAHTNYSEECRKRGNAVISLASSPGHSHVFNVARTTLKTWEWLGDKAKLPRYCACPGYLKSIIVAMTHVATCVCLYRLWDSLVTRWQLEAYLPYMHVSSAKECSVW
jgi:hypothetical protein